MLTSREQQLSVLGGTAAKQVHPLSFKRGPVLGRLRCPKANLLIIDGSATGLQEPWIEVMTRSGNRRQFLHASGAGVENDVGPWPFADW